MRSKDNDQPKQSKKDNINEAKRKKNQAKQQVC